MEEDVSDPDPTAASGRVCSSRSSLRISESEDEEVATATSTPSTQMTDGNVSVDNVTNDAAEHQQSAKVAEPVAESTPSCRVCQSALPLFPEEATTTPPPPATEPTCRACRSSPPLFADLQPAVFEDSSPPSAIFGDLPPAPPSVSEDSRSPTVDDSPSSVFKNSLSAVFGDSSSPAKVSEDSPPSVFEDTRWKAVVYDSPLSVSENSPSAGFEDSPAAVVVEDSPAAVVVEDSPVVVVVEDSPAAVVVEDSPSAFSGDSSSASKVFAESLSAITEDSPTVDEDSSSASKVFEESSSAVPEDSPSRVVGDSFPPSKVFEESPSAVFGDSSPPSKVFEDAPSPDYESSPAEPKLFEAIEASPASPPAVSLVKDSLSSMMEESPSSTSSSNDISNNVSTPPDSNQQMYSTVMNSPHLLPSDVLFNEAVAVSFVESLLDQSGNVLEIVDSITAVAHKSCRACHTSSTNIFFEVPSEIFDDRSSPAKCVDDEHNACYSYSFGTDQRSTFIVCPDESLSETETSPACPCRGRHSDISMQLSDSASSEELLGSHVIVNSRIGNHFDYKLDKSHSEAFEFDERTVKPTEKPIGSFDWVSPLCQQPCSTRGQSESSVRSFLHQKLPADCIRTRGGFLSIPLGPGEVLGPAGATDFGSRNMCSLRGVKFAEGRQMPPLRSPLDDIRFGRFSSSHSNSRDVWSSTHDMLQASWHRSVEAFLRFAEATQQAFSDFLDNVEARGLWDVLNELQDDISIRLLEIIRRYF